MNQEQESIPLTDDQIRLLHLRAQRLIPGIPGRPASSQQVLAEVCGVQAQELPAGHLGIQARGEGLTLAEIEQAQYKSHTILRTWCMRGTLHLISAEDARWLIPLLGPVFIAGDRRRMAQLGWNEELAQRGIRLIQDELARQGGLTREDIRELLKAHGLPYEGQAAIHIISRAALEGVLCQGPNRGTKPVFLPFEDWAQTPNHLPRAEALAELARRYLDAFGPASPEDLASWSGLPKSEARSAWRGIEDQLIAVETTGQPLWLLKTRLAGVDALLPHSPVVRLLPRFDLYLLGYANRSLIVEAEDYAKYVNRGGGILNATVVVDGRVLGTWVSVLRRSILQVRVETFENLTGKLVPLLEEEVAGLGRFLGVDAALEIARAK
jgi:hypothetical protein